MAGWSLGKWYFELNSIARSYWWFWGVGWSTDLIWKKVDWHWHWIVCNDQFPWNERLIRGAITNLWGVSFCWSLSKQNVGKTYFFWFVMSTEDSKFIWTILFSNGWLLWFLTIDWYRKFLLCIQSSGNGMQCCFQLLITGSVNRIGMLCLAVLRCCSESNNHTTDKATIST